MKKINALVIMLLLATGVFAQEWKLDKAHSQIGFTITHMSLSDVDGTFRSFDATFNSAKADFSDAVITATAEIKSINTSNEMRDGHLQGEKYFDAAKFPTLSFKSTSLKKVEGNKYTLTGDLTLHGVTKPITLAVVIKGPIAGRENKQVIGLKATGTIKRKDFGVAPDAAEAMLSDEIALNINGEFSK